MLTRRLSVIAMCLSGFSGMIGCATGFSPDAERAGDCSTYRFDRDRWTRWVADGSSPRREEALALVECNVLASRSKQAVRRLLGRPYEEDDREWSYLLGDEQSLVAIDGEYLTIRFDRGGAVTSVAITS